MNSNVLDCVNAYTCKYHIVSTINMINGIHNKLIINGNKVSEYTSSTLFLSNFDNNEKLFLLYGKQNVGSNKVLYHEMYLYDNEITEYDTLGNYLSDLVYRPPTLYEKSIHISEMNSTLISLFTHGYVQNVIESKFWLQISNETLHCFNFKTDTNEINNSTTKQLINTNLNITNIYNKEICDLETYTFSLYAQSYDSQNKSSIISGPSNISVNIVSNIPINVSVDAVDVNDIIDTDLVYYLNNTISNHYINSTHDIEYVYFHPYQNITSYYIIDVQDNDPYCLLNSEIIADEPFYKIDKNC